jgi:hypothetical protein
MHVWRGELQPDALRPVEHVFASQPGAPYRKKKACYRRPFCIFLDPVPTAAPA